MIRARILTQRSQLDAAIDVYLAVLDHFREFAPAQLWLACLYLEIPEKRDEAYRLASKARKVLPNDPEVAQILAEASYQRKEFAYAIQLLQESANERPLAAKQLYLLGMSHRAAKDKVRSRQALDEALDVGLSEPFAQEARRTNYGTGGRQLIVTSVKKTYKLN